MTKATPVKKTTSLGHYQPGEILGDPRRPLPTVDPLMYKYTPYCRDGYGPTYPRSDQYLEEYEQIHGTQALHELVYGLKYPPPLPLQQLESAFFRNLFATCAPSSEDEAYQAIREHHPHVTASQFSHLWQEAHPCG